MADTRTAIVDAAVEILDSYGLADLSMRRVAAVSYTHLTLPTSDLV